MNEKQTDTFLQIVQERNDLRESNTKLAQKIILLESHIKLLDEEINQIKYNPLIGALPRE